jgi:molecular chaperone DnaJ
MDYNKNYYSTLDVDKNTSENEIKKQYRILSKKYHPDIKSTGNEEKFKELSVAYGILSDSKLKMEYDTRSPHGNSYSPFGGFSSFGNGGGFEFHFGGQDDLFKTFFGGNSPFGNGFNPFGSFHREEFKENLDIDISTNITFKQIYNNDKLTLTFKKYVYCDSCKGTGFDRNSHSDLCEICDGTGINNNRTCEYCLGEGKVYTGKCNICNGEKVVLKDNEVKIQNIFQLRNSTRNAYRGYGHQSKYFRNKVGSLIVNINLINDANYNISNNFDLNYTIDVHYDDAINGTEILYNNIDDEKIKIKLPNRTKNNDIIKLSGKGLLKDENNRGDLYLKTNIIIDYERI